MYPEDLFCVILVAICLFLFALYRRHYYALGLVLVVIAGISAIIAPLQIMRDVMADFPCEYSGYPQALAKPGDSIAYCIDFVGLHVLSGAGIYVQGTSTQDTLTINSNDSQEGFNTITLKRDGQTLKVNAQNLAVGQTFSLMGWVPSINPWLLYANHLTIQNAGIDTTSGALIVTGEVHESWLPNPAGLIALIVGIILIRSSKRKMAGAG